jgi:hypothetical protein
LYSIKIEVGLKIKNIPEQYIIFQKKYFGTNKNILEKNII